MLLRNAMLLRVQTMCCHAHQLLPYSLGGAAVTLDFIGNSDSEV